MKILIAMHDINNFGGIINHTENLIAGFMELGHEVNLVGLSWHIKSSRKLIKKSTRHLYIPGVLHNVSQEYGWLWPKGTRFYYKGEDNIQKWKSFANGYDLVIWSISVPTKIKDNRGNIDWLGLYELDTKQLCVVHDGNLLKFYPHIYEISHRLDGIVCVHFSAYDTVKLDVRKVLIFNPFNVSSIRFENFIPYKNRNKCVFSLQTFKRWKRTDEFVRAILYLDDDIDVILAGDGIERRYMTSETKCLKRLTYEDGTKIWDVALECGMRYLKFITPYDRDKILRESRTLLDASWSRRYASHGGHFNRVVIEAMMQGTIPIARNLGMSGSEDGNNELFEANENYIMVPWNAIAEEFADIVSVANNLPNHLAEEIQYNNFHLLKLFDRMRICQEYIRFVTGECNVGYHNNVKIEEVGTTIVEDSDESMKYFIGS